MGRLYAVDQYVARRIRDATTCCCGQLFRRLVRRTGLVQEDGPRRQEGTFWQSPQQKALQTLGSGNGPSRVVCRTTRPHKSILGSRRREETVSLAPSVRFWPLVKVDGCLGCSFNCGAISACLGLFHRTTIEHGFAATWCLIQVVCDMRHHRCFWNYTTPSFASGVFHYLSR